MRRPKLENWLRRELKHLSGEKRFNMRRIARIGQADNARILPALHLYAIISNREGELLSTLDETQSKRFKSVLESYKGVDLEHIAITGKRPDGMDREHWKHLRSFSTSWHRPELQTEAKETFRKGIQKLRGNASFPMSEGFEHVGIAASNGYAFLAGKTDSVSYDAAARLARWARETAKAAR